MNRDTISPRYARPYLFGNPLAIGSAGTLTADVSEMMRRMDVSPIMSLDEGKYPCVPSAPGQWPSTR